MSDPRFANIKNDPKFKNLNKIKNNQKVKLDSRFSKKDLEIKTFESDKKNKKRAYVDKYGRKITTENANEKKDFEKYYSKEDEEEEEKDDEDKEKDKNDEKSGDEAVTTFDRARGEVPSDYVSSSEEEDDSSSSDGFSEMEDYDSNVESDNEELNIPGQVDADDEGTDPTSVLACVNMDWDNLKAIDLMMTFQSFVPKGGKILSLKIYPSEFGKERMTREETEGPPKELFQKKKSKKHVEEDSDSDIDIKDLYEEGNGEEDYDSKALRRYQLERLRYYYAIIRCDSVQTAKKIYDECDKTEYESTANMFDLRYVPEDMEFDESDIKDECAELPKNFKYNPLDFTTDALQHSKVKLTWDETPKDRLELSKKAFSKKELDEMDFQAYLASDSESESNKSGDDNESNDKISKMKQLVGNFGRSTNLDSENESDDGEVDMEITFNPALSENSSSQSPVNKAGDPEETSIEKLRRKEQERRKKRKEKIKELKKQQSEEIRQKIKSAKNDDEDMSENAAAESDLKKLLSSGEDTIDGVSNINSKAHFNMNQLLKSEKEKSKKSKYQNKKAIVEDDFKPEVDSRFAEVFEDHDFAIDPTNAEYRDTKAMKEIVKQSQQKNGKNKKSNSNNKEHSKNNKKQNGKKRSAKESNDKGELTDLVNKVKKKMKK
ncbi:hypothetical protein ACO0SA_001974 [Hanseniaspora valbyensis]